MNQNKVLMYVLYAILIIGIGYAAFATKGFGLMKNSSTSSNWQAVFLTNGQVYFGKLSGTTGQCATLKEIYYLQVQQQVQPSDSTTSTNNNSSLTLVKLGNELHGPKDEMKINRDQIIFWENMKDDGKVVKAINDYKSGKTPTPTPSATNQLKVNR